MPNFRGVSLEQDGRWSKSDERTLQQMSKEGKFSPILDAKVNFKKVNMAVIQRWINGRVIQLTGSENDIAVNTIVNILQAADVNPKRMQISVAAFLAKNSKLFMEELWTLLVDAQNQSNGIPLKLAAKEKPTGASIVIPSIPIASSNALNTVAAPLMQSVKNSSVLSSSFVGNDHPILREDDSGKTEQVLRKSLDCERNGETADRRRCTSSPDRRKSTDYVKVSADSNSRHPPRKLERRDSSDDSRSRYRRDRSRSGQRRGNRRSPSPPRRKHAYESSSDESDSKYRRMSQRKRSYSSDSDRQSNRKRRH